MGSARHRVMAAGMAGYATDGLLLFLDGINNTGSGHNNSATTWKDLSGNNRDYDIGNNHFADDHLICSSKGLNTSNSLPSDYAYIEMILENSGAETTTMVLIPSGNQYISFITHGTHALALNGSAGDYPRLDISSVFTDKLHYSWPKEYKADGTYNKAYLNNELAVTTTASAGSWGTVKLNHLFCYNNIGDNVYKGNVYAVRIYDHVLSDDERIANWNMDRLRYNL